MSIIEIIIAGLVVYAIVSYLNKPRSAASQSSWSPAMFVGICSVLGLLLLTGGGLLYFTLAAPKFHPDQMPRLISNDSSHSFEYHNEIGSHVVTQAPVVYSSSPVLTIGSGFLLIIAACFLIAMFAVVFSRGTRKYPIAGLVAIMSLVGAMFITYNFRSSDDMGAQQNADQMIVRQNESTAAQMQEQSRLIELEGKPAIKVEQSVPGKDVDINTPTHISVITYRDDGIFAEGVKEVPGWAADPIKVDVTAQASHVFSSGRFATLAEAEQSTLPLMKQTVLKQLTEDYPSMTNWEFSLNDLQGVVIKKRCEVTYPLAVGGFVENVYQVHWYLEIDQEAKQQLYAKWQPTELKRRLAFLGIGLGAITTLLGLGAFATRRRED